MFYNLKGAFMFKRGYVFIYYFILFLFPLLFFACSSSNSTSSVGTIYEDSDPNVKITRCCFIL